MNIKSTIAAAVLTIAASTTIAQNKSVLFIGNSYIGSNNLPVMVQDLALSLGDTLDIDSNTPGGTTFNGHTNNSTTMNKIAQGTFDVVILQAQSQEPSFPPSQVATETYPYAETLANAVKAANPCAEPMFFMTWGRENGDQVNCQFYPPICTYDGMQARLRESYLEMSVDNECSVSPVGAAWKYMRDNYPSYQLYTSDGSHPSIYGSYLAACVHYASIYRKSPQGATYTSSLSASDAAIFQDVANMIVIDSLDNWRIGANDVTADFTSSATGDVVDFTSTGDNGTNFNWNFGDGNTSTSENPTNTYASSGTYDVTLIADDGCTSDTTTQQVQITIQSIEEFGWEYSLTRSENQCNIQFDDLADRTYKLFDSKGALIFTKSIKSNNLEFEIPTTGIYFLHVIQGNQEGIVKLY